MTAAKLGDGLADTPSYGIAAPRAHFVAAHDSAEMPPMLVAPPAAKGASLETWLDLYRMMATAREIDRVEMDLVRRGLAFFHVAGAGHEATACLARHLRPDDWLHVHYRDKALLLARGLPMEEFFASLLCRAGSHSQGRQMSAHLSAPHLNLLSQTGPVGNHALQAVGVAAARSVGIAHPEPPPVGRAAGPSRVPCKGSADRAIVVCATGDGGTQQGQFLEAIAEAVRSRLPVLFLIEDNHLAISTRTRGKTFFDLPDRPAEEFYGLPIVRVDGGDVAAVDRVVEEVVGRMRTDSSPAIVVLDVERLTDHSNADDQSQYRDHDEVRRALAADPIRRWEEVLIEHGACPSDLRQIRADVAAQVEAAAARAFARPDPVACYTAKAPSPPHPQAGARGWGEGGKLPRPEGEGTRAEYTGAPMGRPARPSVDSDGLASRSTPATLTMREALNAVLRHRLATDDRMFLYGQDIEDPKGDVFGVTRGLSSHFPGRVVNSPLAEATIIGACIGRALAGQRPVAFIQFADFLPLAYNQIATELASMYWRTGGGWQCPVIVMITCGGYKPGLGPFHSHTLESIAAHTPGIDVAMPSTAGDAAGLLNAAFESGRPTLFFYPKSCLNLAERGTSADVERQYVPLGRARRIRIPEDGLPSPSSNERDGLGRPSSLTNPALTLVTWGNTIDQCQRAANALAAAGIETDLLDLRSLSPWDERMVIASAERTGRLVIVHEDNHTCGFGAEVAATVAEKAAVHVKIRRVTRPDTFVPCNFGNQLEILPSFKRVLETCADLLERGVQWQPDVADDPTIGIIRAAGSGPADDRVEIVEICVALGDPIAAGQVVAVVEAAKSVVDVVSDISGTAIEILAAPGDHVTVGQPLVRLSLEDGFPSPSRPSQRARGIHERSGVPTLSRSERRQTERPTATEARRVGIAHHDSLVGNAHPTFSCASVGRLAKASEANDGLASPSSQEPLLAPSPQPNIAHHPDRPTIFASRPSCALGSRVVTTAEIAANIPGWTAAEAIKRTGVERRHWIAEGETAVSLATQAAAQLIDSFGPVLPKISAIFCSTTSPQEATPSISCQVLTNLRDRECFAAGCFALDINAACSGFLYGLRLAFDHLQGDASGAALLLTSEILSPGISNFDPATAFLFADAATATLLAKNAQPNCDLQLARPWLVAAPDPDFTIRSPCHGSGGFLQMNGIAVARTAYKFMADVLSTSAKQRNVGAADLAVILPHPGSIRIVQNVAELADVPPSKVWHTLSDTGNTSSSSIPLALDRFWDKLPRDELLGMTAFGAGFTAAAVIAQLKVVSRTGVLAQASRLPAGSGACSTENATHE